MISVIIPTKNRPEELVRALGSALGQSGDLEFIVVFDNCYPAYKGLPKDGRIRFVELRVVGGVSHARNDGIRLAKGEWIALLDDDDEWGKDKLLKQMRIIEEFPDTDLVTSFTRYIQYGKVLKENKDIKEGNLLKESLVRCQFSTSSVLVRKSLLMKLGLFNTNLQNYEDYEMWIKICCLTDKIRQVKECLTIRHMDLKDRLTLLYTKAEKDLLRAKVKEGVISSKLYQESPYK